MEQFVFVVLALGVFAFATVEATGSVKRPVREYGHWDSPITPDMITRGTKGFGDIVLDGTDIYWVEARPEEKGRVALVRRKADGSVEDALPAEYNVRTRAHEYGGAAYTVRDGVIYFTNYADQRMYVQDAKGCRVVTEEGVRFADFRMTRHGLLAIGEDHRGEGEAQNFLAHIDVDTGAITRLAEGQDFYVAPALDAKEERIAWVSWKHPNMPWDSTELWVAKIDGAKLSEQQQVVAKENEAPFQPQWGPDGKLYFVSDPKGWWNFFSWDGQKVECIHEAEAEFGFPHWVFGASSWGFVGDKIFCTFAVECEWQLGVLDTKSGSLRVLDVEGKSFTGIRTGEGFAVFHQGAPTFGDRVVKLELDGERLSVLAKNAEPDVDLAYFSIAQKVAYPSEGGRTAHAFYYPPRNPAFAAPEGSKPPLLVISHGGPTGNTRSTLKLATQYWTSRGFAVLDVNYGGSTGYGRAYREQLRGNWGIVDREDCEAGARYLVDRGLVDPKRLAIRGGSAGGFTTLCCLTFGNTFTVGASYYGVSDCCALAEETHKFESRYLDSVLAPWPQGKATYVERSPVSHTDKIACPVIFFQGDEDKVVPPNQSETMYEALKGRGIKTDYVLFEGEQHGFRQASTIKTAMEKELAFYLDVFDAQA